MTTRHRPVLAAAALVGALALAACGGEGAPESEVASLDDGATATTQGGSDDGADDKPSPADREEAMLEYAECMRDHGIDMPDPVFDDEAGGGGMIALEADPEDGDFQDAQEACGPIMDEAMGDIGIDPEQEAEMREDLLEFAQCMRDHGIDMPDPVFDGDGRVTMEAGPGERIDPESDEEIAAASEECDGPGMIVNSAGPGDESEDG